MFLLFDRLEHESRHCFAGHTKSHPGSGVFPGSVGDVVLLSEAWRSGNRPVQTAAWTIASIASESRMWFRMMKLAMRLRRPGKCAAAERTTSRLTPARFIARVVATALSWSIELGLKTSRGPKVESTAS